MHELNRLQLLVGPEGIERLTAAHVAVFGVGGVGSWAAEALARSGVGHLTIVDSDLVCVTNINRQVQASRSTVGTAKVTALLERFNDINPSVKVDAVRAVYDRSTAHTFALNRFDYVIDAIDSLTPKVELIANALAAGTNLLSALGASCKLDATRIRVSSIWESEGCNLGRLVRKRLRRRGVAGDFLCVYSEELIEPRDNAVAAGCGTGACLCPRVDREDGSGAHEWCSAKQQINGSAVHITGTFGFMLAGAVIQDICSGGTHLANLLARGPGMAGAGKGWRLAVEKRRRKRDAAAGRHPDNEHTPRDGSER